MEKSGNYLRESATQSLHTYTYRAAHSSQAETREARTMEKSGNYLREPVTQSLDNYTYRAAHSSKVETRKTRTMKSDLSPGTHV